MEMEQFLKWNVMMGTPSMVMDAVLTALLSQDILALMEVQFMQACVAIIKQSTLTSSRG